MCCRQKKCLKGCRQEKGLKDKRIDEVMGRCHGHLYCNTCHKVCQRCFPRKLSRTESTICDRCNNECELGDHWLIKCEPEKGYCKG